MTKKSSLFVSTRIQITKALKFFIITYVILNINVFSCHSMRGGMTDEQANDAKLYLRNHRALQDEYKRYVDISKSTTIWRPRLNNFSTALDIITITMASVATITSRYSQDATTALASVVALGIAVNKIIKDKIEYYDKASARLDTFIFTKVREYATQYTLDDEAIPRLTRIFLEGLNPDNNIAEV